MSSHDATQSASAPATRRGSPGRVYAIAGCTVGSTLCASFASGDSVNLVFATFAALLAGVVVLLTTPDFVPFAAAAAPSTAEPISSRSTAFQVGIAAGALSYIMAMLPQVTFGVVLENFAGDGIDRMYFFEQVEFALYIVRLPVDLLIGATIVKGAGSRIAALGVAFLVLVPCTFVSGSMGGWLSFAWYNGFWGPEVIVKFLAMHAAVPVVVMAVGAFGTDLLARLARRRGWLPTSPKD